MGWLAGITAVLLALLAVRTIRMQKELEDLAKQLEETDVNSNLRLTAGMRSGALLRLCRAVNGRLEEGQAAEREACRSQEELKTAISCISHDIRTPLTGASGYVQLLESSLKGTGQMEEEYLSIITRKLKDLEGLLDQLFTYTKLCNADFLPLCQAVRLYDVLCRVLADWFYRFEQSGVEPALQFEQEELMVQADEEGLVRILGNLFDNALKHGMGDLCIRQRGAALILENHVRPEDRPDPEDMFNRFYRADASRKQTGSGLGLVIVRQFMEKMGGSVAAQLEGDLLKLRLDFAAAEKREEN